MKRASLVLALIASLSLASTAQANYVVNIAQSGANVTAAGSGTYDFRSLSFTGFDIPLNIAIDPSTGYFGFGNEDASGFVQANADNYVKVSGPTSFGIGGLTAASSTSGTVGGIDGSIGEVILPPGYAPNAATIGSLTTWDNTTLAGLGLFSGTYVWTWGSGDSFTLNIAPGGATAAVPEPASWALMLAGFGLVGYALRKRTATVRYTAR